MIVETQAEIAWEPRQGHAQLGVFVGIHLHTGLLRALFGQTESPS
jgi:hypothetical protein